VRWLTGPCFQAIDCEPVITLNYKETPEDMAGA
jgi:hypothetical protein